MKNDFDKKYEKVVKFLEDARREHADILSKEEDYKEMGIEKLVKHCLYQEINKAYWMRQYHCLQAELEKIRVLVGGHSEFDIQRAVEEFLDKSGDKTKLKAEIKRLKAENDLLKSMLRGGNQ